MPDHLFRGCSSPESHPVQTIEIYVQLTINNTRCLVPTGWTLFIMLFVQAGIDISAGINTCVKASIDRACVEACGTYVTGVQQLKCAIIKYDWI